MRNLVAGVFAHVDAGKTTLTEAMLYTSGAIRKLGRVDHGDAYLDNYALERERGITIFSKQAILELPELTLQLIDTPGHVDFSGEAERALTAIDHAIVLISGTDAVQSHTRTIWRLCERYHVSATVFINKTDSPLFDREKLTSSLMKLDRRIVDFSLPREARDEAIAMLSDEAAERFLESGEVPDDMIASLIEKREVFPCLFGSALKLLGIEALFDTISTYVRSPAWGEDFAATVYKIGRDSANTRLTYMKLTGGSLRVKDTVGAKGEKIDQLRLYSGAKYTLTDTAHAGMVVAATGLASTRAGDALGAATPALPPSLESVLSVGVELPAGADPAAALEKLTILSEEDPLLNVEWEPYTREIRIGLMGEMQLEILKSIIRERFGLDVGFTKGSIVYRETIAKSVLGVGHFEPLRHYAEVHILIEPMPRGSGISYASRCRTDDLDVNYQRLILTHLAEKAHVGVLTGSYMTDVRYTLLSGKMHLKHTEGGDFREATYRAVRQGLMSAESVLLEPWYSFELTVPEEVMGRALNDLSLMGAEVDSPEHGADTVFITGKVPVSAARNYQREVASYTRGRGRFAAVPAGYRECKDPKRAISERGYRAEEDLENTADSVFCSHEGGGIVSWRDAPKHMHLPIESLTAKPSKAAAPQPNAKAASDKAASDKAASDKAASDKAAAAKERELMRIFERTYGPVKPSELARTKPQPPATLGTYDASEAAREYMLVDGYNMIFAWDELSGIAKAGDLELARSKLIDALCNYAGVRNATVILVLDAYLVRDNPGSIAKVGNIYVIYTKEAETADEYIEKTTRELAKNRRVRVATSDRQEQMIVLSYGALRVSAKEFHDELVSSSREIESILSRVNVKRGTGIMREALEGATFDEAAQDGASLEGGASEPDKGKD